METTDPVTGQPLPADAIQRVLFVALSVRVYNIPPLPSFRGHTATLWTEPDEKGRSREIFTARVRIIETSIESAEQEDAAPAEKGPEADGQAAAGLKVDVVLEDPATGQLFAAAPYTDPDAIQSVLDSSRFFALTVRDPEGRRAVLGIGFEERSEAFDFGVALQEAERAMGWGVDAHGGAGSAGKTVGADPGAEEDRRDYSLKDGETITVNLGGTKFGRRAQKDTAAAEAPSLPPLPPLSPRSPPSSSGLAGFSLQPPPPPAGGGPLLPPPPPPAGGARHLKRPSQTAEQLGFDNGKFNEFA